MRNLRFWLAPVHFIAAGSYLTVAAFDTTTDASMLHLCIALVLVALGVIHATKAAGVEGKGE